jgi:serine/threonine-protein kinase HipA
VEHGKNISISGIQTKHSIKLTRRTLELTDQNGEYILKPVPHGRYDRLSEVPANEHLTMQIASQVYGLNVAINGLVFFSEGEPAYLTKRFDRNPDGSNSLQEDFAQLSQRSEDSHGRSYKYGLSYEEIADLMRMHIGPYEVEVEKFFELVVFNYLVNNGDAHLKNFSLIRGTGPGQGVPLLTPAYDLINTRLHLPNESDTAIELFKGDFETESYRANAYYAKDDFVAFGKKIGVHESRISNSLEKFISRFDLLEPLIRRSYLSEGAMGDYVTQVKDRIKRLSYSFSG